MGYPAKIVFSRHAQTEANAIKTLEDRSSLEKGTQHVELTEHGRWQRSAMGEWLREAFPEGFDAYYVSSYPRTRITLAGYWPDVVPVECALLDEANFGFLHYTRPDTIPETFPHEHRRAMLEKKYHYRPIGGENWPDVELRVRMFLNEVSRLHSGERVFVCGHAAWYTAFRRVTEGLTIEQMFDIKQNRYIPNCSIRHYDGAARREALPGERTHLIPSGGCDLVEFPSGSGELLPVSF